MKLNIKLGVPTADLLKSPPACFRLSKAMTRVSDALSFALHYVKASGRLPLENRDFEHISAAISTSGRSAEDLALLLDDAALRGMVTSYVNSARRFNATLRQTLPVPNKAKTKSVISKSKGKSDQRPEKPSKPMTVSEVAKKTEDLRSKLVEIDKKVESLCTIDSPAPTPPPITVAPPTPPSMRGRFGMGGGGTPKKRPLYPRYFVASMGRSRR